MKAEDRYHRFVRWSDEDALYIGYCPDLFPWGGICHADTEEAAYAQLCELVREEIEELLCENRELPAPSTRPMRDVPIAA